jgi:hypothetical protein
MALLDGSFASFRQIDMGDSGAATLVATHRIWGLGHVRHIPNGDATTLAYSGGNLPRGQVTSKMGKN